MRNVFDQYSQPENRLTHALACALSEDRDLLRAFLRFALGRAAPSPRGLEVVEQQLPGESEPSDDESHTQGLPDAWIYDESSGWALLIESKVAARATRHQLVRHLATARRRGFDDVSLLVLSVVPPGALPAGAIARSWSDVYVWLQRHARTSSWAERVARYLEIAEGKMVADNYLKKGALTVFAGIPFHSKNPYNYGEAKRVLRLAMGELAARKDLQRILGVDPNAPRRPAITGRERTSVWDYLQIKRKDGEERAQRYPHLTLSIQEERAQVQITFPNAMRALLRGRLVTESLDGFRALMIDVTEGLIRAHEQRPEAVPWLHLVQRHYRTQRSEPVLDGELAFDLRTALPERGTRGRRRVKHQPQWLDAAYYALANRKSNIQLGIGAAFPYEHCRWIRTAAALDAIAASWIACAPAVDVVLRGAKGL